MLVLAFATGLERITDDRTGDSVSPDREQASGQIRVGA